MNDQIRVREVRLIGKDNEQLGIVSTNDAKQLAYDNDLDLVLISPQATPPVAKIMDYGKFRYETEKKLKESRRNQKAVELKEVWLSATIDTNDMMTKAKSCIKFLQEENRVRASIRLKGRQMAHPEIGMKVMADFYEIVKEYGNIEKKPSLEGRSIAMIVVPINKK